MPISGKLHKNKFITGNLKWSPTKFHWNWNVEKNACSNNLPKLRTMEMKMRLEQVQIAWCHLRDFWCPCPSTSRSINVAGSSQFQKSPRFVCLYGRVMYTENFRSLAESILKIFIVILAPVLTPNPVFNPHTHIVTDLFDFRLRKKIILGSSSS